MGSAEVGSVSEMGWDPSPTAVGCAHLRLICKVRVITMPTRTKQVLVVNPSPGPDTSCLKDTSSKETSIH